MKAKKALKRLAKIEALMSDVTERFPNTSLQIQGALKDAKAAFARVKEAVSLQVSSEAANDSKAPSTKTPKPAKRQLAAADKATVQEVVKVAANADQSKAPTRKKPAAKTMSAKTPAGMTAKKRAPIKKAAKKSTTPKETAQAPVDIPTIVETDPTTLETAPATVETAPVAAETAPVTVETTPATVETVPDEDEVQTESVAQMSAGN